MSDLHTAIQLIRQGQKFEAQRILQELIKTEPNNIPAWFWYVETITTTERRIQVMETCLKMNPGNPQVAQALQQLRGIQRSASSFSSPAPAQPEPPKPQQNNDLYGYNTLQSSSYEPVQASSLYEEEKPAAAYKEDRYGYNSFPPEPLKGMPPQKQPWEMQPSEYEDTSMLSKPEKPARAYSTFDVWMTAVTSQDEKAYEDVLRDPEMGLERAFTWTALAGVVSAFVVPLQLVLTPDLSEILAMPEIQSTFGGSVDQTVLLLMITLAALLIVPLGGIINLAIFGGIQNFLAMFFGGGGNYTRTVYALAAFLAPMTIITSLAAIVPVVGGCLSLPLAIYNFILNIRALKAAHALTNGAAVGVMLAPTLLILLFVCMFLFMSATSLSAS